MAEDFEGAASANREGRQGALASAASARDAWGTNFPTGGVGGFSSDEVGGMGSLTAGFQRGMDFSGSGDMAGAVSDPFAYVGGGSGAGAPTIAAKPVTGTPMQQAAQAAPQLDPVLQEAIEDPRNKTQLLRYEQEVQKFLRDQSGQRYTFQPMGGYHRLMMHRLAEYYCMEHEVEEGQWGADQGMDDRKPMTLYKTPASQMPRMTLADHSDVFWGTTAVPQKEVRIAKRDRKKGNVRGQGQGRGGKGGRSGGGGGGGRGRNKTVDEKEREYAALRAKIMGGDDSPAPAPAPTPAPAPAQTQQQAPAGDASLAAAPDGTRGFGRGRGRGGGTAPSNGGVAAGPPTGPTDIGVGRGSGAGAPGPVAPAANGRGGGQRMSQEQFQQNLASRQQRWQEQQHDPDFDRSYHRYAPREAQMYPQQQQQQQYSLFGGGGGYSAAGQQPQQFDPAAREPPGGFAVPGLGPAPVDPAAVEPAEGFGNGAASYETMSYGGGSPAQGQQAQYQYGGSGGSSGDGGGYQGQAQTMYGYGGQDGGYNGTGAGGYGGQPQHTHAGYVTGGISAPLGGQDYQQHRNQVWGEYDNQYPTLGGEQQQHQQYYQSTQGQRGNGRGGHRGGYSSGRGGYRGGGGRAGGRGYNG